MNLEKTEDLIPSGAIRILPLGGLGEIGMNCLLLETAESIVMIDCGLLFSDLDTFGIEYIIPDFKYLLDRKEKFKSVILTHGHEDHIGAVPYLFKAGLRPTLHASTFTALMLREKLKEFGFLQEADLQAFKPGESFQTAGMKVETISVNHSIVDACALAIETPAGVIVHTGDFKIDRTPYYGKPLDAEIFKKLGDRGVALLLSDSTNVEKYELSESERTVFQSLEHLFAAAEGLTIIAMFSSNVSRVSQVFELAKKQGKKVALSGRSMEQNVRLAMESGHIPNIHSVLIPLSDIENHKREEVLVLTTGTQGELRSSLKRIAQGEHSTISIEEGDRVLMSSRFIPGNERAAGRMINQLFEQGADVIYQALHTIHVSGHATRPELQMMIEWTQPRFFLPIHGEYRHMVLHGRVAEEAGLKTEQILVAKNGDILELSPEHFLKVDEFNEPPRKLIDGNLANEISAEVLRTRRRLAEGGAAFILCAVDPDSRRVVAGPEVLFRGVASTEFEQRVLEEAKKITDRVVKEHHLRLTAGDLSIDLSEALRISLRKLIQNLTGKKITVIPYLLEI